MRYDYDALVLGGGPGGYVAAIRCAQHGLKTALVEADELGGTCLNRGCIPTKALLHGAQSFWNLRHAEEFGITSADAHINYGKLADFKDAHVERLRRGIAALEKANGVTVIKGFGRLSDDHTADVSGKPISADKIILATGSEASLPPIPGIASEALTSDDVLSLRTLPQSAAIIGAGAIGIEFATLFSALDVSVTVIETRPDILPGVDPELSAIVRTVLEQRGVRFLLGTNVLSISPRNIDYEVDGVRGHATADKIIACTGRRPRTAGIGLEALGIVKDTGYIPVDDHMRTAIANVYAVGDITGKVQLAHAASAQGLVAAAHCAGKGDAMRYDVIPACVYTSPELAYVGLTEQTCLDLGRAIRVGRFPIGNNGRSAILGDTNGLCKLVSDARTGEILGCQLLAPHATEMIGEIAAIMRCEGTIDELSTTIHPHPTVSEIIWEAANASDGMIPVALHPLAIDLDHHA